MISNPLKHIGRQTEMIGLLYKYGTSDLIRKSGLAQQYASSSNGGDSRRCDANSHDWEKAAGNSSEKVNGAIAKSSEKGTEPEDLSNGLESMGPAFIKLGQLLSTRPDFLSKPYLKALHNFKNTPCVKV